MTEEIKKIRVGVIGAGNNTIKKHIPGLLAEEAVEIVSVCNRSQASSTRVANQFNIPRVCSDWRALIDDPDIDAVVIGTWPYLHCPTTLAALSANKHVMVEARMAMNGTEAQQMWDASRKKPHLVTQVVPSPFTLHLDQTIQRLITEGFLGDLLAIEVRDTGKAGLNPDIPLHWRQNADFSGLNVLSMGIWYEALMRWVGEAQRVSAMGKVFVKMRKDPASGQLKPVRVPDHVNIIAEMACGAQASFWFSDVAGLPNRKEAILFGSHGALQFLNGQLFGRQYPDDPFGEIVPLPEEKASWRVEAEFVGAIRGLEPIRLTPFEVGVKYMRFTDAVAESMVSNRVVHL